MRLLVIGANGLLGSNVVTAALERDWSVYGTYHTDATPLGIEQTQLDICNDDHVRDVCARYDPEVVVNCAAMTDVDACEAHPVRAQEINSEAPGVLARCAARLDAGMVHISTDYVFDGTARKPYAEAATPNPVQSYGRTKLAGERAVRDAADSPLIPRLSFVYGIHRSTGSLTGFPAWVIERLRSGRETPLFTDQYVTPTRAGFAAECILDLVANDVSGILNIACRECVTPFAIGRAIADKGAYDRELLTRQSMAALDRPAERPSFSCLATDQLGAELSRDVPSLSSELDLVL